MIEPKNPDSHNLDTTPGIFYILYLAIIAAGALLPFCLIAIVVVSLVVQGSTP